MAHVTFNRGRLLSLARAGKLTKVEGYRYEDGGADDPVSRKELPVRIIGDGRPDFVDGYCNLRESDFKSKSGTAYRKGDTADTVVLIVHSNRNYTFRVAS